jgi:hypothetical protein
MSVAKAQNEKEQNDTNRKMESIGEDASQKGPFKSSLKE